MIAHDDIAGDFDQYRLLIMSELKDIKQALTNIDHKFDGFNRRVTKVETDMAIIKAKAGIIGAVMGVVSSLIIVILDKIL
jgi:hypothetical protein